MSLRKLQIAALRFTRPKEKLTSTQEEKRLKNLIADLKALCPQADSLLSSTLCTSKLDDPDGVILQYWLYETEQRNLQVSIQRAVRHQDAGNDGFANEVRQLTQEVTEAQGQFIVAVEPTYTAEQLRSDDLFTRRIRKIRKRVKARDVFQIPTADGAGIAVSAGKHSNLPTVYRANIEAKVHSGIPEGAKLNDAKFIGDIPDTLVGLPIPNQILLRRPHSQENPKVARILDVAMDNKKSVRLSVLVNLDWVDGSIHSFTYCRMYKRPYKKRIVISC
jgi:hypothetical protein